MSIDYAKIISKNHGLKNHMGRQPKPVNQNIVLGKSMRAVDEKILACMKHEISFIFHEIKNLPDDLAIAALEHIVNEHEKMIEYAKRRFVEAKKGNTHATYTNSETE